MGQVITRCQQPAPEAGRVGMAINVG